MVSGADWDTFCCRILAVQLFAQYQASDSDGGICLLDLPN